MNISYVAVVRGKVIIASHGDGSLVSERDIQKLLPPPTSRIEQKITSGRLFTFVTTPALTFMTVSPQSVEKQKPITFLDTLSRRWTAAYGPVSASAGPHGLNSVFQNNFAQLFDDANRPTTKTSEIARQLDETQQILTESMSKALIRGTELDAVSAKTEDLLTSSEEFRSQASNLKWRMKCQQMKSWVTWVVTFIAIFYVVLSWICGGWGLSKCF